MPYDSGETCSYCPAKIEGGTMCNECRAAFERDGDWTHRSSIKQISNKSCEHLNFQAHVEVARLSKEDGGPIDAYHADVRIHCNDCGEKFAFLGLPNGLSGVQPTCGFGGFEARLPLKPSGEYKQ